MRLDAIRVGNHPPDDINVIIEVPVGGEPINRITSYNVCYTKLLRTRLLLDLVLDRLAADRNLDDDVDVIGWIVADANRIQTHDRSCATIGASYEQV